MKLENLLHTLSEDGRRPHFSLAARVAAVAGFGCAISGAVLVLRAGLRPDAPAALFLPFVQIKAGFVLLLVLTAYRAVQASAQPERLMVKHVALMLVAPVWIACGIGFELATTPSGTWLAAAFGAHPLMCLLAVPMLAMAPLAFTIGVMRNAAPASPAQSGACVGLFCGALGAAVYMLRCTDDAPLFVGIWYLVAILLVAAAGALAGRTFLRW